MSDEEKPPVIVIIISIIGGIVLLPFLTAFLIWWFGVAGRLVGIL